MSEQNNQTQEQKNYSQEEIVSFVADIERNVANGEGSLHSVIALNHILRQPDAHTLLDDELKTQLRDLWVKLTSLGLHIAQPPLLFGAPTPIPDGPEADQSEDDGTETVVIGLNQKTPDKDKQN